MCVKKRWVTEGGWTAGKPEDRARGQLQRKGAMAGPYKQTQTLMHVSVPAERTRIFTCMHATFTLLMFWIEEARRILLHTRMAHRR